MCVKYCTGETLEDDCRSQRGIDLGRFPRAIHVAEKHTCLDLGRF